MDEAYLKHSDVRDEMDPRMSWQAGFLAPGIDPASYAPTRDTWGPIVIPEDRYFMLGDNRETSLDSRYWGLIEGWRLEGRAVFIYFSYNWGSYRAFPAIFEIRWGRLGQGID
jgi:signal peptidase I